MKKWVPILLVVLTACTSAPATPTSTLPPPIIPATETPTPFPTFTPTATPLPHLMYPYTIAGLRERDFPGGEIQIGARIAFNDQFSTFLISYPSEGLTITGVLNIPAGEGPFPVIVMNHGFYRAVNTPRATAHNERQNILLNAATSPSRLITALGAVPNLESLSSTLV